MKCILALAYVLSASWFCSQLVRSKSSKCLHRNIWFTNFIVICWSLLFTPTSCDTLVVAWAFKWTHIHGPLDPKVCSTHFPICPHEFFQWYNYPPSVGELPWLWFLQIPAMVVSMHKYWSSTANCIFSHNPAPLLYISHILWSLFHVLQFYVSVLSCSLYLLVSSLMSWDCFSQSKSMFYPWWFLCILLAKLQNTYAHCPLCSLPMHAPVSNVMASLLICWFIVPHLYSSIFLWFWSWFCLQFAFYVSKHSSRHVNSLIELNYSLIYLVFQLVDFC